MSVVRILLFCLLLSGLFAAPAAQAATASPPAAAPLVGRVSAIAGGGGAGGAVMVRPAGGAWAAAAINDPVAGGMSLRTAAPGRAKLRIGADTVALAPDSELDLGQLDANAGLHLVLHQGRIGVLLTEAGPAHPIEIDMPRGRVWLTTAGAYDIAAGGGNAPDRLAVFDGGNARFVGTGGAAAETSVAAGWAVVLGGGNPAVARLDGAVADDFAAWWRPAMGDAAAAAAAATLAHVSAAMTGYDALDKGGSWQTVTGYGAVWFPATLPAGWAPYRYGHWRWLPPWGWTWIDDMAWGFTPSHYGRWARLPAPSGSSSGGERWGWVPGVRVADPEFMPAAVAFLGTAGVGISYPDASGPAVAWFPLAPGEVYWPSYTHDLDTIRRINRGAVADVAAAIGLAAAGAPPAAIVDGVYRNREFASVVPRAVFVGGKPVAPALVQLPAQRLNNAPLLAGSPGIVPPPAAAARPVAMASASAAPARRPASATAANKAEAMRTLARILRPLPMSPHRGALAVGWRMRHAGVERPRILRAAVVLHGERRHLRFAAFRRRR
jgi:hypothetical protein